MSHQNDIIGELLLSQDVSYIHFSFTLFKYCHFFFCQGAILNSTGSLENNENVGTIITQSIQLLSESTLNEPLNKISFLFSDHAYVAVKAGKNIKVVHKRIQDKSI